MGVAIGASQHPSVDRVLALKEEIQSAEQVMIFGQTEKADILLGSLINGMSSHIFNYDDTHLDTIHHPSGTVVHSKEWFQPIARSSPYVAFLLHILLFSSSRLFRRKSRRRRLF